jgi:hypothetical protein
MSWSLIFIGFKGKMHKVIVYVWLLDLLLLLLLLGLGYSCWSRYSEFLLSERCFYRGVRCRIDFLEERLSVQDSILRAGHKDFLVWYYSR